MATPGGCRGVSRHAPRGGWANQEQLHNIIFQNFSPPIKQPNSPPTKHKTTQNPDLVSRETFILLNINHQTTEDYTACP